MYTCIVMGWGYFLGWVGGWMGWDGTTRESSRYRYEQWFRWRSLLAVKYVHTYDEVEGREYNRAAPCTGPIPQ